MVNFRGYKDSFSHPSVPIGDGEFLANCARPECGKEFVTKHRHRAFCSLECRRYQTILKQAVTVHVTNLFTTTCAYSKCKHRFLPSIRDKKYCSTQCRKKAWRKKRVRHESRACKWCRKPLPDACRSSQKFCGNACRNRAYRAEKRR